ncbi:MAG: hypothetical protein KDJ99_09975, partial [Candidatus Competibacteraceae bacterium]|nr:hypothetical protein [Candidatus Competibacteraceae bacterium]
MTRRNRWLLLLAGSLIIALALSPYLIGWQIERQLNAPNSPLKASPVHAPALQVQTLQRGWLNSQANSTLVLPGTRLEL